jgi:hypothetical protein
MRQRVVYAILCGLVAGAISVSSVAEEYQGAGLLQVDVPFEPTAFTSASGENSAYTLAQPKVGEPLRLQRIETSNVNRRNPQAGAKGIHLAYEPAGVPSPPAIRSRWRSASTTADRTRCRHFVSIVSGQEVCSGDTAPPRLHKRLCH